MWLFAPFSVCYWPPSSYPPREAEASYTYSRRLFPGLSHRASLAQHIIFLFIPTLLFFVQLFSLHAC